MDLIAKEDSNNSDGTKTAFCYKAWSSASISKPILVILKLFSFTCELNSFSWKCLCTRPALIRRHRATRNIVIVKVTSRWTSACTVRYVAAIIVTQQHDLSVLSRSYTVYRGVGAFPLKNYFRRVYVRKALRVQISSIYSQLKRCTIPGKSPSPEGMKKVP